MVITQPVFLSVCIKRNKLNVFIALPTNGEIVKLCKKTLINGFGYVNTEMLMPNFTSKEFKMLNIDDRFKMQKISNLKIIYRLQLGSEGNYSDRRVVSKILEMDENNQYGQVMTKLLPTGCIKKRRKFLPQKNSTLSMKTRVLKIKQIIYFWLMFILIKKFNKKSMIYNELYTPIFEKEKS